MYNNVAKISDLFEYFDRALENPDNRNSDGTFNWNFVDADVHMDASEAGTVVPREWADAFESMIEVVLLEEQEKSNEN